MRVADKMALDQVRSNLGKNRSDMAELQNQAATQKRLTKPSLDPVAATRVLATRSEISGNNQFMKSIQSTKSFLEYTDQSLSELSNVLNRAKELAISQSSDASASSETRKVTATEVSQLFEQTVQLGNRKLGDRFIFAGFHTNKAPFDNQGRYKGDEGEIKIAIGKDAHVAMNLPGSHVFLGKTGKAGAGGGGNGDLFDIHEEIHEKIPSGIPGVDGEINGEINVRGPASPVIPAEMERWIPDAVKQELPPQIQQQSRPVSGGTVSTGTNVFQVLSNLEASLRADDKIGVQESLDQIDEAMSQVVIARAEVGSRVSTITSTNEAHLKGQVEAKSNNSLLEDADTFELVSDINRTEGTLKASLETSGKLIQPSLLDFLK